MLSCRCRSPFLQFSSSSSILVSSCSSLYVFCVPGKCLHIAHRNAQLSFAWDKPETKDGLMRMLPRKPGKPLRFKHPDIMAYVPLQSTSDLSHHSKGALFAAQRLSSAIRKRTRLSHRASSLSTCPKSKHRSLASSGRTLWSLPTTRPLWIPSS